MGIPEILSEWIKFRMTCVRRELTFDLKKKEDKLHLLLGLGKILLDIDKAIKIIRGTEHDADVVPNLMKGFGIDEIQADYIADIKLRYLNREYILNRIQEIDELEKEIAGIKEILADDLKLKALIAKQLAEVKAKHGKPRKSYIVHEDDVEVYKEEENIENYNVRIYLTRDGYFKKITLQSLRGNDEQKLKEGDEIISSYDTENIADIIFVTDKCQLYRCKVADFDTSKASAMGDFVPVKLNMDNGEKPIFIRIQPSYPEKENFVFIFENGKGVRVPATSYITKAARRKLVGAYSDASPIVAVFYEKEKEPYDIMLLSENDRAIVIKTSLIPAKSTRTSAGVQLMTLKKGQKLKAAYSDFAERFEETKGYKKIKIPATGILLSEKDIDKQQLKF
jgi:DNA gyrase subunit A